MNEPPVFHILSRVERDLAKKIVDRRLTNRIAQYLRFLSRDNLPSQNLPRLDLIWLPHYLYVFSFHSAAKSDEIALSLQAHAGAFSVLLDREILVDGPPPGEHFAPRFTVDEGLRQAKNVLLTSILSRRGQRGKPVPKSADYVQLLYHPYWIYYFRRWKKYIDFHVLDAVSGQLAGGKIKTACLAAFEAAHDAKTSSPV
jgi:hypothetical protein